MTFLYKPITLILKFYYMSNGLTFEIFNINLRNLTGVRTWLVNVLCKISRKSVQNWLRNRRKACDPDNCVIDCSTIVIDIEIQKSLESHADVTHCVPNSLYTIFWWSLAAMGMGEFGRPTGYTSLSKVWDSQLVYNTSDNGNWNR